MRPEPKMLSTVVVIDTTLPCASRTMRCDGAAGLDRRVDAARGCAPGGIARRRRRAGDSAPISAARAAT